ncbi:DUF1080 domain-containing protein [Sphingomonas piscis]|uniref:DUF1080 domain-containing protein n=2 Tax=Sphingomonas piscis TaxID=2714943 RepID=A0A6G7YT71_9SPHN|nr:DUF1080 domain-containing protein [Sphingomonas piscis]
MIIAIALAAAAQQPKPEETEQWTPVPPIVTPGPVTSPAPPSDAVVLLGSGTDLKEWASMDGKAAAWTLNRDGSVTVKKGTGNIQTRRSFTNYQLHLEWRVPVGIKGEGQGRGNSGLFLASTGAGDSGYELQIVDSFNNKTYVNGQAASIYKQSPPLANAMRAPGQWQTYDVIWHAPVFNADGSVKSQARVTAFHNGVLVQDDYHVTGETAYIGKPQYEAHGPSPIKLQDHGDPSQPISFRNIWVRELP